MVRRTIREKSILFLCADNSCTSQMAEVIANRLAPPKTRIFSAGINPRAIDPTAIKVMQELGLEMLDQRSKSLEAVPLEEIDLVVAFGEAKDKCPPFPAKVRLELWSIPDPRRAGGGEAAIRAAFRYVRDEIDKKVAALFLDYWRNVA
jgi:arsenate reductase